MKSVNVAVLSVALLAGSLYLGLQWRERNVAEQRLKSVWAELPKHLESSRVGPEWLFTGPSDAASLDSLRRLLVISDSNGNVLECSSQFRAAGMCTKLRSSSEEQTKPKLRVMKGDRGQRYLILSGIYRHRDDFPLYVAIGADLR
jgi:hypothetical protein